MQVCLAPMKRRLFQETVGKYGFKKEFASATVDTMRDVLAALTDRYRALNLP